MLSTKLFDLSGRVAVVTDGNSGIGRGIALGLAQAGSAVAVLARNEEKNQRVMDELHALGVPALAVKIDLAERGQLQPALDKVEKKLPRCLQGDLGLQGRCRHLASHSGSLLRGHPSPRSDGYRTVGRTAGQVDETRNRPDCDRPLSCAAAGSAPAP
jgi:NAD(P)-dependent dehydrogenase (short-subunit alcohol dehydrogenase family)